MSITTVLALTSGLLSNLKLNNDDNDLSKIKASATKNIGIKVSSLLSSSYLNLIRENLVTLLNRSQQELFFFVTNSVEEAHIFITSSSFHKSTMSEMLFMSRLPGGLRSNDYDAWLRSDLARHIVEKNYSFHNFYPIYLGLSAANNLQICNTKHIWNGAQINFITSNKFSWRALNKNLNLNYFSTIAEGFKALSTNQYLTMEPLQPWNFQNRKTDDCIFIKDTLSMSPAVYQLTVPLEVWSKISNSNQTIIRHCANIISDDMKYYSAKIELLSSGLINTDPSVLPTSILTLKMQDEFISNHFFEIIKMDTDQKKVVEIYNSFRNFNSLTLA